MVRFSLDGDLWVSDGDGSYLVRRQTLQGDTLLLIERSYDPVAVPPGERAEALEGLRPPEGVTLVDYDLESVPHVYPPFDSFLPASDGTLWVRRDVGQAGTSFDVFDVQGFYLGQVDTSAELSWYGLRLITADRLYAVEADELGVQSVVILRIERPEPR
jgi:hypothetical protein